MSEVKVNKLSVVYLPRNIDAARAFFLAAQSRFPDVTIEQMQLTEQQVHSPSGAAVAVLFDASFSADPAGSKWLKEWPANRGLTPLMPIALDIQFQKPPDPIGGIKSRVWPADSDQLLTTIGASLGMALRPGKQQLFISYRQLDGTDVAKRLYDYFSTLGFNPWLDVADDRHGDPNLEIGDEVQKEIMARLVGSNAMIHVDTPSAPHSPWVCAEVETAVGMMIPILPVVFHDNSVKTQRSRFRELNDLHRRVCIQSDVNENGQFLVNDDQVAVIANEMMEYLQRVYLRRVIQPRILERAFVANKWKFGVNTDKSHLHQATLGPPPTVPINLLGCCSFEDAFFPPTCRLFLDDIAELAGRSKNFLRSLYFYDGQLLFERDVQYIVNNEITNLRYGNVDLVHYDEAIARVLKITGGLHGIFG